MKKVNYMAVEEFDSLVVNTYGRPYSFQQQDGCRERGTHRFEIPIDSADDFQNDTVPEVVNGEEMGVKFESWLMRDPKQKLSTSEHLSKKSLELWWHRNFYPDVSMVLNDLFKRGLIPSGHLVIEIDW